jgi:hypothetical protein
MLYKVSATVLWYLQEKQTCTITFLFLVSWNGPNRDYPKTLSCYEIYSVLISLCMVAMVVKIMCKF